MAHLQLRAMPQERDLREHGTTLFLCVKVGKAAVADPDLQISGGGGGGHADPEIRGPALKENKEGPLPLDPPLGKLYFVGVVIYFIFVIVMVFLSLT